LSDTGKHIVVCGFPRSGNRWIIRLLAYYADERGSSGVRSKTRFDRDYWNAKTPVHYFGQAATIYVSHIAAQGYWAGGKWNDRRGTSENTHLVHTWRDPRDVFVSWYHLLRNGSPLLSPGERTWKGYLSWLPRQREHPFRPYMESWLKLEEEGAPNVSWIHHEEMIEDRAGGLLRIIEQMGLPVDQERAQYAAAILEEEPLRASYRGGASTKRGAPGEWKAHFDAEDARLIEGFCGDLIVRLGYGGDPDWEQLLERTKCDQVTL